MAAEAYARLGKDDAPALAQGVINATRDNSSLYGTILKRLGEKHITELSELHAQWRAQVRRLDEADRLKYQTYFESHKSLFPRWNQPLPPLSAEEEAKAKEDALAEFQRVRQDISNGDYHSLRNRTLGNIEAEPQELTERERTKAQKVLQRQREIFETLADSQPLEPKVTRWRGHMTEDTWSED